MILSVPTATLTVTVLVDETQQATFYLPLSPLKKCTEATLLAASNAVYTSLLRILDVPNVLSERGVEPKICAYLQVGIRDQVNIQIFVHKYPAEPKTRRYAAQPSVLGWSLKKKDLLEGMAKVR